MWLACKIAIGSSWPEITRGKYRPPFPPLFFIFAVGYERPQRLLLASWHRLVGRGLCRWRELQRSRNPAALSCRRNAARSLLTFRIYNPVCLCRLVVSHVFNACHNTRLAVVRSVPAAMGSDCGSPGSAAGGPGLKITRGAGSVSAALSVISPSPSSQRPADSLSPSPENGHRRTQTQRVRDLLSSIDGLVMESEQPEEAPSRLSPFSPSNNPSENGGGRSSAAPAGAAAPLSRSVRGYKRQSTGAVNPRGGGRSPRMSLRTPPPAGSTNGGGEEEDHRSPSQRAAFFPNERDWRGGPFGATHPPELAGRPASVIPDPGAEDGDDPAASADMLLAEVGGLC